MHIQALKAYQKSHEPRFAELPPHLRAEAERWLAHFVRRRRARHQSVPPWLHAVYCGQAKRLALHPPDSAWGRSMHARRGARLGGHAVQRLYRAQGRHPTATATYVRRRRRQLAAGRSGAVSVRCFPGGVVPPIVVTGVTDGRENGCATAEAILQDIRRQAFAGKTRFHPLRTEQPRRWVWRLELVEDPGGSVGSVVMQIGPGAHLSVP